MLIASCSSDGMRTLNLPENCLRGLDPVLFAHFQEDLEGCCSLASEARDIPGVEARATVEADEFPPETSRFRGQSGGPLGIPRYPSCSSWLHSVALQPVAYARHSTLVRCGSGMRAMEDAPVAEQPYTNPEPRSHTDFSSRLDEQRLDVSPRDVAAGRMTESRNQSLSVRCFTTQWYRKLIPIQTIEANSVQGSRLHIAGVFEHRRQLICDTRGAKIGYLISIFRLRMEFISRFCHLPDQSCFLLGPRGTGKLRGCAASFPMPCSWICWIPPCTVA